MIDTLYVVTAVQDTLKLALQSSDNSGFYLQFITLLVALAAVVVGPLIQLNIAKKQIKFSTLHKKQAEVISDLYSLLVIAQQHMIDLTFIMQMNPKPLPEKKNNTNEALTKLSLFFFSHKIYFNKENCDNIDKVIKLMKESFIKFNVYQTEDKYTPDKDGGWQESWEIIDIDVKSLMQNLEIEFKKILKA